MNNEITTLYGKWEDVRACIDCHHVLSKDEYSYSYGRCPYCGHKGKSAVTFVASYSFGRRKVSKYRKEQAKFLFFKYYTNKEIESYYEYKTEN